ncbi:ATP-binding cassette sub-family C member 9-like [Amphiura filiformis]|uniref:ATP-binding cassette sub-family C member 9-like n=1 Tax=Amphiura filiformis TaxID=82378 RepID=UPI003B20C5DE
MGSFGDLHVWFCGLNKSSGEDDLTLGNTCRVDALDLILQFVSTIVFFVILLIGVCLKVSQPLCVTKFPAHTCRWLLLVGLLILLLGSLAEGIITDSTFDNNESTKPHLYLTQCFAILVTLGTYYCLQLAEMYRLKSLLMGISVYWICSLSMQTLRLLSLQELDAPLSDLARSYFTTAMIVIYGILFLLNGLVIQKCWQQTMHGDREDCADDMYYRSDFVNTLSKLTYWWLNWLPIFGYKRVVTIDDLGVLPIEHRTKRIHQSFMQAYEQEKERASTNSQLPSLWRVYFTVHGTGMVESLVMKIMADLFGFVGPLALGPIIVYVSNTVDTPANENTTPGFISMEMLFTNGFFLVGVMFIATVLQSICNQTYEYWVNIEGVHIRSAIQVIITLVALYFKMGFSSTLGASVFIITISSHFVSARYMSEHEKAALNLGDQRLKSCNEVLQGMKLIKLLGWQDIFFTSINKVRELEVNALRKIKSFFNASAILTDSSPLFVTMIAYGTYTALTGLILKPDVALPALALFNIFQAPIFLFPIHTFLTKAKSIKAGDEATETTLINRKQFSTSYGAFQSSFNASDVPRDLPDDVAIKVQYGSFTWNPDSSIPIISDVNIEIPRGKLTMVIGEVGSGKSSLISAMLGEMTTLQGSVQFHSGYHTVALASQTPWLINESLRDNILFGQPYDQERYESVLEACALLPDIEILPGRDMTEIGEKGINLSGGQKQRISVARAVYSSKDIVILDDPLSSLDAHVGAHLFENAIMRLLVQRNTTVILVTHQIRFVPHADQILVLKNGLITFQGRLQDMEKHNPDIFSYVRQTDRSDSESSTHEDALSTDTESERRLLENQARLIKHGQLSKSTDLSLTFADTNDEARLLDEEEIERGTVSYKVYWYYFSSFGWTNLVIFTLFFICYPAFVIGANFWLVSWADAGLSNLQILWGITSGYMQACVFSAIVSDFIALVSVVIGAIHATRIIHFKMFRQIMQSPMRFFDITPLGRILNRFSADTEVIDSKLFDTLNCVFFNTMACLSAAVVNVVISPYFLLVIIPIVILCYYLQWIYIASSRELQRLDSVTKSPVFSHFSETLGGLQTIRAYRCQRRFYNSIMDRVDVNNTVFLYLQTMNRWLGVRLDFLGATAVLFSGIITVTMASVGYLAPGYVGLAIAYALQTSDFLNHVVTFMADLEMQMNAVERVKFYTDLPTESFEGQEPSHDWPSKGKVQAQDIWVRYAHDTDAVLKDVSFTIHAGQKIGICGRTGSGKTSLTLAFFRLIDTYRGRILIDDEDIGTIPLTTLRKRLAIIPQDPILFSGTIRFNLDPEGTKSDGELWQALDIAQLKNVVGDMRKGLDGEVSEGGENFSVGQRQLFCLARAFLNHSQVLIMDEATASIDHHTVQILQKVLSTAFAKQTVITIAHRVSTILDSDTIFVLQSGEIVENDTPEALLANDKSIFYSLVLSDRKKYVKA